MRQEQLTYPQKWLDEPEAAFADFLASADYAQGNRSSAPLPADHRLTSRSARVYVAMFGKYLRHLDARGCAVPQADAKTVREFFTRSLANASRETVQRYIRLLERTYAHLGVTPNPVSTIARGILAQGKERAGPDESGPPVTPTPSAADMRRLMHELTGLAASASESGDCLQLRNVAMMAAAIGAGLRNIELSRCRLADTRWRPHAAIEERVVFVVHRSATTSLSKFHEAPVHPQALAPIEIWLREREAARKHRDSPFHLGGSALLFPSTRGGLAMGASAVVDALDHARTLVGKAWPEELPMHGARSLRTLYAKRHLLDGGDATLLQARMGLLEARSVHRYGVAKRTG